MTFVAVVLGVGIWLHAPPDAVFPVLMVLIILASIRCRMTWAGLLYFVLLALLIAWMVFQAVVYS